MHNKELVLELLHQLKEATQKIVHRFQIISQPDDFSDSSAGMEKMDAICMMLIVMGELLKRIMGQANN